MSICLFHVGKYRSCHPKLFCKKDVLKNLAKFTGKLSCEFYEISKNTSGRLLLKIILIDCLQDIITGLIARCRQMKILKKSTQFVVSNSQVTQTYS